jgi:hypothetical protein
MLINIVKHRFCSFSVYYSLGIFLAFVVLVGCQTPPPKKALLTFENQRFEKIYGNCEDKEGDCLHILLDYPLAKEGKPEVKELINLTLQRTLTSMIGNGGPLSAANVEEAVESLVEQFMTAQKQNRNAVVKDWILEAHGGVIGETPELIAFKMSVYTDIEATKNDTYTRLFNFDIQTGKNRQLLDFVYDTATLRSIIKFFPTEDKETIPIHNDLPELPLNFAITARGLLLYYNPSETVNGKEPTEIVLPLGALDKIWKK